MRMRYTLLLNDSGGILDDLMATRLGDGLFVVVNAATKDADLAHLREHLGGGELSSRSKIGPCWHCRGRPLPRSCRASPLASQQCRS